MNASESPPCDSLMKALEGNAPSSLPRLAVSRLVGHDGPIQAVIFTDHGKYCFTAGNDRSVRLWNPARLDPAFPPPSRPSLSSNDSVPVSFLPRALPIQTYEDGLTHSVSAIAVGSDEKQQQQQWLLSASDKTAVLSDVVTGKALRRFHGHFGRINRVAFSQDAETYLTASYDATVRIWDGRSRSSYEPIQILKEAKDSVTAVHTIQDKSTALIRTASVDGILRTYDLRMGMVQCDDCASPIVSMAPTYDGQCIAVSCLDGRIRLLDCNSGELMNTFHSKHVAGKYGLDCCMTSNDANIVTGSEDGRVILYDIVRASAVQTLNGHTAPTCAVAAHPNESDVVITASYDGNAVVWASGVGFMSYEER